LKKYNIDTIDKAAALCPIYLHSFDYGTVKYWGDNSELPNNFLSGGGKFDLSDVVEHATGIGFSDSVLWNYQENRPSDVFLEAKRLGLVVHMWTFKDDVLSLGATSNIVLFILCRKCTE
jgi:hypothetical protein